MLNKEALKELKKEKSKTLDSWRFCWRSSAGRAGLS